MAGVRDHKVFLFKITYDQQHGYSHMNEVHMLDEWTNVNAVVVLIAPDDDAIAKAFFDKLCKFRYRNLRLIEMQKLDINGALTEVIYG